MLVGLGASELKIIYEDFLELNNHFFKISKKEVRETGREDGYLDNLFSLCCDLIESGHTNVFNYGYSYFLRAFNNNRRIRNGKIADVANAVRVANHADDRKWKKYIRGLVGR